MNFLCNSTAPFMKTLNVTTIIEYFTGLFCLLKFSHTLVKNAEF